MSTVRYGHQRSQDGHCGPLGILNAEKFQGKKVTVKKHLKARMREMKETREGVNDWDVDKACKRRGYKKLDNPTWVKIAKQLFAGRAVLLTLKYVSDIVVVKHKNGAGIRHLFESGHIFLITGICVCNGEVRYHPVNFCVHKGPVKDRWMTSDEMIRLYSKLDQAYFRSVYIIPRRPQ